jgi:hypothetical protein
MTGNENNETGLARDGKPQGGGLLEVIVHSAEDVEGRHHTNPYAKVLFRGDERKTQVCGFIILDVTNCQLVSKVLIGNSMLEGRLHSAFMIQLDVGCCFFDWCFAGY